jgi:dihydrofolate synthase/folylpolyglutamate synthase
VVALESIRVLRSSGWKIDEESIKSGLARAFWPGRLQAIGTGPAAVLDVAHNPMGAEVTVDAITEIYPGRKLNVVFGACADKDWQGMLESLRRIADAFVLTQADNHRSLDSSVMMRYLDEKADATAITDPSEAVHYASALDGLMLVTGSHYLLGDVWSSLDGPSLDHLWDN